VECGWFLSRRFKTWSLQKTKCQGNGEEHRVGKLEGKAKVKFWDKTMIIAAAAAATYSGTAITHLYDQGKRINANSAHLSYD
jgi:hypothetical protein